MRVIALDFAVPSSHTGFGGSPVEFLNGELMPTLPRNPHRLLLESGLLIIVAIELYKFIRFIAQ
jgi:hypothetical protein